MNSRCPSPSRLALLASFASEDALAESAWRLLCSFFETTAILQHRYVMTLPARPVGREGSQFLARPDEALAILRDMSPPSFVLRYDEADRSQVISFLPAGDRQRYHVLSVTSEIPELLPENWAHLIEGLAKTVRLAIAGTYDAHYLAWQRCNDPSYYSRKYGSIEGFRILRPLPYPFDNVEKLDTSANPGRYGLVTGGLAFVCAELWLGSEFWNYAPCKKEEILREQWLEVTDSQDFLYLRAYRKPFTRPDGEQGLFQRRLWQLLFRSDCCWPPDGGGSPG